jgi:hypothetical protein
MTGWVHLWRYQALMPGCPSQIILLLVRACAGCKDPVSEYLLWQTHHSLTHSSAWLEHTHNAPRAESVLIAIIMQAGVIICCLPIAGCIANCQA